MPSCRARRPRRCPGCRRSASRSRRRCGAGPPPPRAPTASPRRRRREGREAAAALALAASQETVRPSPSRASARRASARRSTPSSSISRGCRAEVAALDRGGDPRPGSALTSAAGGRRRLLAAPCQHGAGERVLAAGLNARPRAAAARPGLRPAAGSSATTDGLPSVSVPVLSKATVSTECATSSASASLIRMPCRAATPVPAMIAVGVASPSAQGQAITSTATALMTAVSIPVAAERPPAPGRSGRDREHHRHEHGADPVDEALDRRLGGLRALDQADDARERRSRRRPPWSRPRGARRR